MSEGWLTQAERLLSELERWTGSREALERDYVYQKSVLYTLLVDLVPPTPLRTRTLRSFADFLKNVAITAGPAVASQTGFSAAQREAIAFAFQFGSLILPAIVPAIVWVLMHRRFLERLRQGPALLTRQR